MNSKLANNERLEFGKRLRTAMTAAGYENGATALAREFNARTAGRKITASAFRKWLNGEGCPVQTRLYELAKLLNVSPEWLRFGDGEQSRVGTAHGGVIVSSDLAGIVDDFRRLDANSKRLFKEAVAVMLRTQAEEASSFRRGGSLRGVANAGEAAPAWERPAQTE